MNFLHLCRLFSGFKEVIEVDIVQIVSIGIIGAILSVILKKYSPELSVVAVLVTGVLMIMVLLKEIGPVVDVLKRMAGISGIDNTYIEVVLKVVAISYISEFGVEICNDAGVSLIASKIELGGKVLIMAISAPVFLDFMERVISLV